MKRTGYIYDRICSLDNILLAIDSASRHKRGRRNVQKVLADRLGYAEKVRELLCSKTFTPSEYRVEQIRDNASGKQRTIHIPKFYPDQIVHWALVLQLKPVIMRGMYEHSCGSIPGRGQAHGQRYLRRWLDRDPKKTKYCLKMDVSKFYQSIDHYLLKQSFRRVLKDPDVLNLIDLIIDSVSPGLPIGNYTSQWFANFYLQELDHEIKEKLAAPYYIRYVDDMVLLGPNKKRLHAARKEIEAYLRMVELKLKADWQVFPVKSRAIDFLGYRFYRDHTTLRARNALRIRRRVAKIRRKPTVSATDAHAIISYLGIVSRCDSARYRMKYIDGRISIRKLKGVLRNESREQNCASIDQSGAEG